MLSFSGVIAFYRIFTEHDGILNDTFDNLHELEIIIQQKTKRINAKECMEIHRAIIIDIDDDYPLLTDEGLGIFWSWDEFGAIPHGGSRRGKIPSEIIIRAWIPLENVNWDATVYKNIYGLKEENEVETLNNVEVFIHTIEIKSLPQANKVQEKAELIAKTYFSKKYEKLSNKYSFVNKIERYLKENGLEKEEFSITFDDYYKSLT